MKLKRRFMITACLTVLGLLLFAGAGCAPAAAPAQAPARAATQAPPTAAPKQSLTPNPQPPSSSPKPAADQPRYGGILPVALYAEPPSLDLHQHQIIASRMAAIPAYDTLLETNPLKQDEIIPDLAERYDVTKDGLEYTFRLQKGAKFHDGSPLTAEDVKYTLERLRNPPRGVLSPRRTLLASIDRIDTPDASTVRIVTKYPDASFISALSLSHHVVYPRKVVEEKGDMKKTVMGTGPFKFVRYDTGVIVQYVKNADYFRKGRPYLDGLTLYIITDPTTGFAAFRTGRVLLTSQGSGGLNAVRAEITERELKGKARPLKYVTQMNTFVLINVSRKPLDDVRVRRALHLAADRQAIMKTVWPGDWLMSLFFVPEPYGKWGFSNEEISRLPGYRPDKTADVEEAKKLLADAGHGKGLSLSILSRTIGTHVRTVEMLREQYKAIGVDLKLEMLDTAVWTDRKAKENYELLIDPWSVHADDPSVWLENILSPDISFKDNQLDQWRKEQARILDFAERKKLVRQIELRLLELLPVVPSLRGGYDTMGVWENVKNYPAPIGTWSSHKYTEVWLGG
ncbi:MAG: ABC transporter substrate-binding protein [Chloroflexi bacterium]|nr:ABC transporter substrate-binding protein [Chloroflexota bacterium]